MKYGSKTVDRYIEGVGDLQLTVHGLIIMITYGLSSIAVSRHLLAVC